MRKDNQEYVDACAVRRPGDGSLEEAEERAKTMMT
jgi:hypothetical protein